MLEVVGAYLTPKGLGGAIMCFYGHIYTFYADVCSKKESISTQAIVGSSPCDIFLCDLDFSNKVSN